ncbi:hypothetical protein [Picosynechococcus sp. NKBG15041c]|uniref:hypothetical protein n=1 Tax=Picosynechococcus sp. NKBG15041c TaxID=1407650 RepID=UPI000405A8B5|nr:hypothetical protein [Picosynechococcus sp. NKBG15041c]
MILNAITPDISWIASWNILQQLCHLWRRFGITTTPRDRLYLSSAQLQDLGLALDYDVFHLLVEAEFVALLWAKDRGTTAPETDTGSQYEISMVFDPQAIAPIFETLLKEERDCPPLAALRKIPLPQRSAIPPELMVGLLEIARSPSIQEVATEGITLPNQPLNVLLSQRLEQEKNPQQCDPPHLSKPRPPGDGAHGPRTGPTVTAS